uniref:Uncharacterized protein n=1 Tax=Glossina pallidipes TaxID=7398 RepID=A0A1B0AE02_GLOPL
MASVRKPYSIRNENVYNLQKPSVVSHRYYSTVIRNLIHKSESLKLSLCPCKANWRSTDSTDHHDRVQRQLSVSSDSKLLDDDIREETRVIMRPKKPPRPKSEVFLNKQDPHPRRKRFSAFGL